MEPITTAAAALEAANAAARAAQTAFDAAAYAAARDGATVREIAIATGQHATTVRAAIRRAAPKSTPWVDVPLFDVDAVA